MRDRPEATAEPGLAFSSAHDGQSGVRGGADQFTGRTAFHNGRGDRHIGVLLAPGAQRGDDEVFMLRQHLRATWPDESVRGHEGSWGAERVDHSQGGATAPGGIEGELDQLVAGAAGVQAQDHVTVGGLRDLVG